MSWFCYIIKCSDGSLYTGIIQNLAKRLKEHQNKRGARYTAKYKPTEFLWFKEYIDRKAASKKEKEIKGWRREKKLTFIKSSKGKSFGLKSSGHKIL